MTFKGYESGKNPPLGAAEPCQVMRARSPDNIRTAVKAVPQANQVEPPSRLTDTRRAKAAPAPSLAATIKVPDWLAVKVVGLPAENVSAAALPPLLPPAAWFPTC